MFLLLSWFLNCLMTYCFPDSQLADPDGLLAVGGDPELRTLVLAYENGIFQWFSE